MEELAIALTFGVLQGSVYSLVALGIVLVYRVSGVFNFAQAEFGTTGLFGAYIAIVLWEWPFYLGLLFGLVVAVVMGLLTERLVIHPLRNQSKVTLLVGTAGVALTVIGIQFWQFNDPLIRQLPKISDAVYVTPFGAPIMAQQMITLAVLIVAAAALAVFLKSPAGLAMQAAQQDPVACELVGVSVRRVSMMTWGIAALLGGLAGVLSGAYTIFTAGFLTFGVGKALLPGFIAAVLAGMKSMPGAVAGGLVVGIVEQFGGLKMFGDVPGASALLLLVFLVVVLLLRPQGLLVRKATA